MISLEEHSDTAALVGRLFFSSMFLLLGYGKVVKARNCWKLAAEMACLIG